VWIDEGRVMGHGDPKRMVDMYLTAVEKGEEALLATTTAKAVEAAKRGDSDEPHPSEGVIPHIEAEASSAEPAAAEPELKNFFEETEGRWGSREIEITDVTLLDKDGAASFVFHSGDAMGVRVTVQAREAVTDFVFGIGLFNAEGVCCYGTNTYLEEMTPVHIEGTVQATFEIERLDLVEGTYKLDVAIHKRDGFPYDYHRLLYTFRVKSRTHDAGIYRPPHRWRFSGAVQFTNEIDKI